MSKPRALNPQTKHPTPPKPPTKSGEIRDTHQISDVKSWTPIKISIFFNQPHHPPSCLNGPIARHANTEIRDEIRDTHQNPIFLPS